ncbi:hypothetical protein R6Q57_011459, partial [Mikania cordata]
SYALLTRPPLETPLPVRLACVKQNEHEEINDTSLSFELFCRIGHSRSLVSTRTR